MNKKLLLFFPLFAFIALASSLTHASIKDVKAENENIVYLDTSENVTSGSTNIAYVYLATHEELSALSLEVHFSEDVISVDDTYNFVSSGIYDYSITDDGVNYTYIFDNINLDETHSLFYFYYSIDFDVNPGKYYFDIVISEAYNSSLESVEIVTSRKYINVASSSAMESVDAYLTEETYTHIDTSYNNEFTFSYWLDNSEPSSGVFHIRFDDTLFEFVSLTKLSFFDNMLSDYSVSQGEIIVSFIEVVPDYNYLLLSVTLRVISNVTTDTEIELTASELYDSNMNPMGFTAETLNVFIAYDSSYEELPSLFVSAYIDTSNHQVVFTITLEEESHLGAGDFIFKFDKDILTYVSYEKLISPTLFSINDKDTQLEKGQIKFSILSLTDIVDGDDILELTFSYTDSRDDRDLSVTLEGSGLTDSLTNPISLDISGVEFTISGVDLVLIWANTYLYMNDSSFDGPGVGLCISSGLYETAKREFLKLDSDSRYDFENNSGNKYTSALERYLAWARANNDYMPFADDYNFLSATQFNNLTILSSNPSLSVIALISASCIFVIVGYIFFRKREQ